MGILNTVGHMVCVCYSVTVAVQQRPCFLTGKVSLKAVDYGKVEEASGATVRQVAALQAGISSDKAKELNKFIKGLGIKGVQSQTQGDQLRVNSKKRDDLQAVITALKEGDFDVPLQFENFRD